MRVLFIGNSYTYCNDMPALFAAVCAERGTSVEVDGVLKGGWSLEQYLSAEDEYGKQVREKLAQGGWNYVVLQEQSLRPSERPQLFLDALKGMVALVRAAGAKPVLYETWGRADWSPDLARNGWTHEEMQKRTRDAYEQGGRENDALVVYAGDRMHEAYRRGEAMYEEDGSHPSDAASRIIAEAFADALL